MLCSLWYLDLSLQESSCMAPDRLSKDGILTSKSRLLKTGGMVYRRQALASYH